MDYQTPPQGKDPHLWNLARVRVAFRRHLATYLVVNIFLWLLWFFTENKSDAGGWPWPLWPTLGWGVGVTLHYVRAYVSTQSDAVDKEYEKLQNKSKL